MRNTKCLIMCAIMCITSGIFSAGFIPVQAAESNNSEVIEAQNNTESNNTSETESMSYIADTPNAAAPDDSVQKYTSIAVTSLFVVLAAVWIKMWKKYGK